MCKKCQANLAWYGEVFLSRATGLKTEVSNDWHLYRDKSFNNLDKSKMVNGQHSCIHHRKTLRWQESFTTFHVLHRTEALCRSQIFGSTGGLQHIALEAAQPTPATWINYLLLMLKNAQFSLLLMKSSDVLLKFHDSECFASWGGG